MILSVITGINESKTLTKHRSCEYKYKFDSRKCNWNYWWNKDKYRWKCKNHHVCEKDCIWNPTTYSYGNGKYLASIMDDSPITCDEIIESYYEETKTIPTNFNEKKATCKMQNLYILLVFSLIIIALLIAVSIYCYLIKYKAK